MPTFQKQYYIIESQGNSSVGKQVAPCPLKIKLISWGLI